MTNIPTFLRFSTAVALGTSLLLNATETLAQTTHQEELTMKESTHIPMTAKPGQESALASFLTEGAQLVAQTEPNTLHWYALKNAEGELGIFDFFTDAAGRDAHFAGQVAAALKAQSKALVSGGWDQGVVANVSNAQVLSHKLPGPKAPKATLATHIVLHAQCGQEAALESLLIGAASVIEQTGPTPCCGRH